MCELIDNVLDQELILLLLITIVIVIVIIIIIIIFFFFFFFFCFCSKILLHTGNSPKTKRRIVASVDSAATIVVDSA